MLIPAPVKTIAYFACDSHFASCVLASSICVCTGLSSTSAGGQASPPVTEGADGRGRETVDMLEKARLCGA